MDIWDGLIIGVAGSVIGGVILARVLNLAPVGGDTPSQPMWPENPQFGQPKPLAVVDLPPTPANAAPVQQTNPITEAAHNINTWQTTPFAPGFGPDVATANDPAVLPY